jgi:hypothetical protein
MVSAAMLVLAALRVAFASLRMALAFLRGSLAPVTLGVASVAVAAAAAVAPAVPVGFIERLADGLARDGRLCRLAAEQPLQPSDESPRCRLWRRGCAIRRNAVLAAHALVELRARLALRLVATEVAHVLARGVGPVLPAIRAERGPAVVLRVVRTVAEMGVPPWSRGGR